MNSWLRGPLKDVFQECVVESKELAELPINHKPLLKMFEEHLTGQGEHARALWILLSLALWERRHYRTRRLLAGTTPEILGGPSISCNI